MVDQDTSMPSVDPGNPECKVLEASLRSWAPEKGSLFPSYLSSVMERNKFILCDDNAKIRVCSPDHSKVQSLYPAYKHVHLTLSQIPKIQLFPN